MIKLLSLLLVLPLTCVLVGRHSAGSELDPLLQLVAETDDPTFQLDVLTGIREGLQGARQAAMPDRWKVIYPVLARSDHDSVRLIADELAIIFGDEDAWHRFSKLLFDDRQAAPRRLRALQLLASRKQPKFAEALHRLLDDAELRRHALRALSAYSHPKTAVLIIARYSSLDDAGKQDALLTLSSRVDYARQLLDALADGAIPRRDVSSYTARQIGALRDETVSSRLRELWGELHETAQDKRQMIAEYKAILSGDFVREADLSAGRIVFSKTCASCHCLFGEGGQVGPDLTGSNRGNLDYFLQNVIAPSATIGKDYQMNTVELEDGRVLQAIIVAQSPKRITLQTANERIVLTTDDVFAITPSRLSLMPEGQITQLTKVQVRDLFAYLRSPSQVPLD